MQREQEWDRADTVLDPQELLDEFGDEEWQTATGGYSPGAGVGSLGGPPTPGTASSFGRTPMTAVSPWSPLALQSPAGLTDAETAQSLEGLSDAETGRMTSSWGHTGDSRVSILYAGVTYAVQQRGYRW